MKSSITLKLLGLVAIGLLVYLSTRLGIEYYVRHGLGAPAHAPETALDHRLASNFPGALVITNGWGEVFVSNNGHWYLRGPR